jgi:hypothetical protein
MKEKVIETKKCRVCGVDFDIYQKDLDMLNKLSPVF